MNSSTAPLNPIHPDILPELDPLFVQYYNNNLASRRQTHQVPLQDVRARPDLWELTVPLNNGPFNDAAILELAVTTELEINEVGNSFRIRAYYPSLKKFGPGPYAVHINFHGGGWMFGSLHTDARICMLIRDLIPLVVLDVDYRLCPESEFGQNIKDTWSALLWTRQNASMLNIKISSLSIGGTSSGAHLASILQYRARDEGIDLKLFVATVPTLADHDRYTRPADSPWPSFSKFSNAPLLNWTRMKYFQQHVFLCNRNVRNEIPLWWISPLRAPNFEGLCDTFLVTAGCDPLRDEGEGYGRKLVEAGNKVLFKRYLKVPHPFMQMSSILPQAKEYEQDVVHALKCAHGL